MMKLTQLLLLLLLIACKAEVPNGIEMQRIDEDGFKAKLLTKEGNHSEKVIIIVPGSGGGFIRDRAILGLVNQGYNVFSMVYFGESGLPKQIEQIPIEGIHKSIAWLKKEQEVKKIIVIGISKGAELSLLYASKFDDIDGLICYSPSNIILPNHVQIKKEKDFKSSWTYQGIEVPYAKLKLFKAPAGNVIYKSYIDPILKDEAELLKAEIEVEKIKCPLLLLSGKEDQVWPAYPMSKRMEKRIQAHASQTPINAIGYEDCGHQFLWFGTGEPQSVTTSQSLWLSGFKRHRFIYGGSIEGTKKAMKDSKIKVFEFIAKI